MNASPIVCKISIYPLKSLDGVSLQRAKISEGGCLLHDREYALADEDGNFIIGKTNPLVHGIRSELDFEKNTIFLKHSGDSKGRTFHLENELISIQHYLSAYFGFPVFLQKNLTGRFLDMPDISGITILSTASLQSVAKGFHLMDIDETRKRFRATIEIEGVPAFWEDHLFASEGTSIEFTIGNVTLFGMSPRARCVVPTRHPESAEVLHAFPKSFSKHRSNTLPIWSQLSEFGHYYFLSVNCFIPASEYGKYIEVGDQITIKGKKKFH